MLRIKREQRGWSQAYVADAINVSVPTVSRLESGQMQPSTAQVYLLATLFGVRQGEVERWCGIESQAA